jgi:ParB family chromosome partitioning protein
LGTIWPSDVPKLSGKVPEILAYLGTRWPSTAPKLPKDWSASLIDFTALFPISAALAAYGLQLRFDQADRLARETGLDMVQVGWRPTVGNYLGRVTKPRILEAVREGAGERAAQLIDHMKKGDMAKEAERLLADSGWLPEPLRLADPEYATGSDLADQGSEDSTLPAFLSSDGEDDELTEAEDEDAAAIAAE